MKKTIRRIWKNGILVSSCKNTAEYIRELENIVLSYGYYTDKQYISDWITTIYNKLFMGFGDNDFSFDDAVSLLNISKESVSTALSSLHKSNKLKVRLDPSDNRKRIYKLVVKNNE